MGSKTLAVLFVTSAMTACAHGLDAKELRRHYAQHVTCPDDRIVVARRTDLALAPAAKDLEPAPREAPPPEIAQDPERLAVWNERQGRGGDESRSEIAREYYRRIDLYEVSGCGAPILYGCQTTTAVDVDHAARGATSQRVCDPAETLRLGSDPPRVVRRTSSR